MVQLSATRCGCIAILWVSLVSFAAVTLYVASQRVFIVISVNFVIDSIRKLLDTPLFVFHIQLSLWSAVIKNISSNVRKLSLLENIAQLTTALEISISFLMRNLTFSYALLYLRQNDSLKLCVKYFENDSKPIQNHSHAVIKNGYLRRNSLQNHPLSFL
jgi:hypothetical protein